MIFTAYSSGTADDWTVWDHLKDEAVMTGVPDIEAVQLADQLKTRSERSDPPTKELAGNGRQQTSASPRNVRVQTNSRRASGCSKAVICNWTGSAPVRRCTHAHVDTQCTTRAA